MNRLLGWMLAAAVVVQGIAVLADNPFKDLDDRKLDVEIREVKQKIDRLDGVGRVAAAQEAGQKPLEACRAGGVGALGVPVPVLLRVDVPAGYRARRGRPTGRSTLGPASCHPHLAVLRGVGRGVDRVVAGGGGLLLVWTECQIACRTTSVETGQRDRPAIVVGRRKRKTRQG